MYVVKLCVYVCVYLCIGVLLQIGYGLYDLRYVATNLTLLVECTKFITADTLECNT